MRRPRLANAWRDWLSVSNRYDAMKTTPNIRMPSYSQHAIRRVILGV